MIYYVILFVNALICGSYGVINTDENDENSPQSSLPKINKLTLSSDNTSKGGKYAYFTKEEMCKILQELDDNQETNRTFTRREQDELRGALLRLENTNYLNINLTKYYELNSQVKRDIAIYNLYFNCPTKREKTRLERIVGTNIVNDVVNGKITLNEINDMITQANSEAQDFEKRIIHLYRKFGKLFYPMLIQSKSKNERERKKFVKFWMAVGEPVLELLIHQYGLKVGEMPQIKNINYSTEDVKKIKNFTLSIFDYLEYEPVIFEGNFGFKTCQLPRTSVDQSSETDTENSEFGDTSSNVVSCQQHKKDSKRPEIKRTSAESRTNSEEISQLISDCENNENSSPRNPIQYKSLQLKTLERRHSDTLSRSKYKKSTKPAEKVTTALPSTTRRTNRTVNVDRDSEAEDRFNNSRNPKVAKDRTGPASVNRINLEKNRRNSSANENVLNCTNLSSSSSNRNNRKNRNHTADDESVRSVFASNDDYLSLKNDARKSFNSPPLLNRRYSRNRSLNLTRNHKDHRDQRLNIERIRSHSESNMDVSSLNLKNSLEKDGGEMKFSRFRSKKKSSRVSSKSKGDASFENEKKSDRDDIQSVNEKRENVRKTSNSEK